MMFTKIYKPVLYLLNYRICAYAHKVKCTTNQLR